MIENREELSLHFFAPLAELDVVDQQDIDADEPPAQRCPLALSLCVLDLRLEIHRVEENGCAISGSVRNSG
jgi:hypothetical protein